MHVAYGVVVNDPDELVLKEREAMRTAPPVAIGIELIESRGKAKVQEHLQPLHHGCSSFEVTLRCRDKLGYLLTQCERIEVRCFRLCSDIHRNSPGSTSLLGRRCSPELGSLNLL